MDFWATGMPWQAVAASIDGNTFEYNPGSAAVEQFELHSGHPWDNLDDSPMASFPCPRCKREIIEAPWTTCASKIHWTPEQAGRLGTGMTERYFSSRCKDCQLNITHDILRTQKFAKDMQNLLTKGVPMPGTFLSLNGGNFRSRKEPDLC
jgi:hypothetical protein